MPESKNRYTKTHKKRTLLSKRLRHCVVTGTVLGALDFILFMADFIVAGHFLGKDALAGLTLANPMITFLTFSNIILPAGTAAAIAYLRGRGDKDRANGLFSQGLILTVVLGLLFSVVLFIGAFFFKDTSVSCSAAPLQGGGTRGTMRGARSAHRRNHRSCFVLRCRQAHITRMLHRKADFRCRVELIGFFAWHSFGAKRQPANSHDRLPGCEFKPVC